MNFKKILLIGGSGFIGRKVADLLYQRGTRVLIPARHRDHVKRVTISPTAFVVEADVHDPAVLRGLMCGMDAVINLVGVLHDNDSRPPYGKRFSAAHVELPEKIVAAMQAEGVRRLIHLSALKAAADSPAAYSRSKAAGEAVVLNAANSLDVTIFRPSVIFGPEDKFLNVFASMLKHLPILPLIGANARLQPVSVDDVAQTILASLNNAASFGRVYELAGPRVYTLRELIDSLNELLGTQRPIVELPPSIASLLARLLAYLPSPPVSPDNLRMLQVGSVSDGSANYPGWQPGSLEASLSSWPSITATPRASPNQPLTPLISTVFSKQQRLDAFRSRAGRLAG